MQRDIMDICQKARDIIQASDILYRKHRVSLLAAIEISGIQGAFVVEGAFNTELFNFGVQYFILDKIDSFAADDDRSAVVLDNARIHDSGEFKEMIRSKGGIVIFLPPYSPDFNPIERSFYVIKEWLSRHRDEMERNPKMAVYRSLDAITPAHAEYFFQSCGY